MILLQKLVVGEAAVRLGQGRLANWPVYLSKGPTPANEDQGCVLQKTSHVWFEDHGNCPLSGYKNWLCRKDHAGQGDIPSAFPRF
jgi:hypothetical protein